jgi:exportin-2 (importin alpha re-exporter)
MFVCFFLLQFAVFPFLLTLWLITQGVMRVIVTARSSLIPIYGTILQRLTRILSEVSKNPSNPKFNHYLFESIAALIR